MPALMELTFHQGGQEKSRHISKYVAWYLAVSAQQKNKLGGGCGAQQQE